jgi:hypothetical protein
MESVTCNESLAESKGDKMDPRKCSLHIHSKRKRLTDTDGISFKAAIDGICAAGILSNDSASIINKITSSQEISKNEETIIDIYF